MVQYMEVDNLQLKIWKRLKETVTFNLSSGEVATGIILRHYWRSILVVGEDQKRHIISLDDIISGKEASKL
jgi:hypothetical protein